MDAGVAQPLAAGPRLRDAALGVGEHPQGVVVGNGLQVMVVEIEEGQGMAGGSLEIELVQPVVEVSVTVYSVVAPAERLVVEFGVVGVGTEVDFVSVVAAASAAGIVLVVVAGVVVDLGGDTAACTAVAFAFVVAGAASVVVEKE